MNFMFFENILLSIIFILFPLFSYLFYVIYNKIEDSRKKEFIFVLAITSTVILIMRYGYTHLLGDISYLISLINIPIIIAYLYGYRRTGLIFSIIIVSYYVTVFESNVYFRIIEYVLYYVLGNELNKRKLTDNQFINIFVIIKTITCYLELMYSPGTIPEEDLFITIASLLVGAVVFYAVTFLVKIILYQTEGIMEMKITIKDFDKSKKLYESLSSITHEIKNPIAVAKGFLEMYNPENKEHAEKYLPIIKSEIDRAVALMDDYLSASKIKVNLDIMDLGLVIEDVIALVDNLIDKNKITIHNKVKDDDLFIEGDYNRLKQVFLNIVKNAIESIPEKRKGSITIECKETSKNYKVFITDDGIGMTKEQLAKIGEPFYTSKKKGTGLGVMFSREIISKHGGTIEYISKRNVGTTVIITLKEKS